MWKMIKISGMMFAVILIPFSAWGQAELKIGYVDAQAIIAESTEAIAVEEQIQREMVPWESELQSLQGELEGLIEQYQTQQASMTPQNRVAREQLIMGKQEEFQNRAQEIESLAAARQRELVQPLMERINSIIENIRLEGSYTFIFNSSTGVFLSADERFDLTGEVTQRLTAGSS